MSVKSYTSQLKGWAVDRVIELYKQDKSDREGLSRSVEDLKRDALALVEFAFNEEECELHIRENIEKEKYDADVAAAVAMKPASNALDKLKVVTTENPQ
jgi:beta-phosphoglucomutase-like phosphatase (HAD superfamily)